MSDRAARLEELREISGVSDIAELEKRTLLELNRKNLISVPLGVWDLTGLVALELSENQLSSLPPEISQLTRLKVLYVYNNQISSLPPEISQLTRLKVLYVYNNQISSLPPEISRLTGLKVLYVYNNQLSSLSPEISQLTGLEWLSVTYNQLSSLPAEISRLIGLAYLDVRINQLSSLPPEISRLTGLTQLNVGGNPIEELPRQITALTKLKELHIEWEGEISIKRAPRGITNLPCWNNTGKEYWMTMSCADALQKLQLYGPLDARVIEVGVGEETLKVEEAQKAGISQRFISLFTLESLRNRFPYFSATISDRAARLEALQKISGDSSIAELEKRRVMWLIDKNLTSVPLSVCDLIDLVDLRLGKNQLLSLPPEISRLTGLVYLGVGENQLSSLSPEISRLTGLETLGVGYNRLSSLPSEISRLTGLTWLDVSDNQLSSLPAEISQLTGLTWLDVSDNQLSSLPAEISQLTGLETLGVGYNRLLSLLPEILQLTGLVNLGVQSNQLSSLPPEISRLTGLVNLGVYCTPIEELPRQITALTNLKNLYIESKGEISIKRAPRGITNLPCWNNTGKEYGMIMSFADALQKLRLYDPFMELQFSSYEWTCISAVDLSRNQIGSLPNGLSLLTNITNLNISHNKLSMFPSILSSLSKVERLHIQNNHLSFLSIEIPLLQNLTYLDISNNRIQNLSQHLARLGNLQYINIHDNKLSHFCPEIWRLSNLTYLNVSRNKLSIIPCEISKLVYLVSLHIYSNNLSFLPRALSMLTCLSCLDVANNRLSTIPKEASTLVRLRGFNISNNQLSSLPLKISQLAELKRLQLCGNRLSSLPPEISCLANLDHLDVSNNPIEELQPQITALTNLKNFYVQDENGKINIKRAPRGITNLPCWNNSICENGGLSIANALRKMSLYDLITNATRDYEAEGAHKLEAPKDPYSEPVTGDYADVMGVEFSSLQILGKGGFGTVYKAQLKKGIVAVKLLKTEAKPGTLEYDELTREAKMMTNLRHRNIISLHAYGCKNWSVFYVMEYADDKSIWDAITKKEAFPFDRYIQYSIHINAGLKYLHGQNPPVEHRDLKPENVLLCNGVAKICDFGISSARETVSRATTGFKGTFHYAAPEYFNSVGYGPMSDIYSFALVIWAMIEGKRPYDGMTYGQITAQKMQQKFPEMPPTTPAKLAALMNDCWNTKACSRPSAAGLEPRLADIQNNPGDPVGEKGKSVKDMSNAELVAYLEKEKALPSFVATVKAKNRLTGFTLFMLTKEDLTSAPYKLNELQADNVMDLIDEAKRI